MNAGRTLVNIAILTGFKPNMFESGVMLANYVSKRLKFSLQEALGWDF